MSYILDALKQSDRQRQRGKVPDLQSWQSGLEQTSPPPRRWPYWVLGGAAMIAVLLIYAFQGRFTEGVHQPPVASMDEIEGEKARDLLAAPVLLVLDPMQTDAGLLTLPAEVAADLRVQLEDPVMAVKPSTSVVVQGGDSILIGGVAQTSSEQSETESAPGAEALTKNPAPVPASEQVAVVASKTVALESRQKVGKSEAGVAKQTLAILDPFDPQRIKSKPKASRGSNPVLNAENQVNEEAVIHWRQLPLSVQRSLPSLDFTVHIYSKKPRSSMVKINGVAMREGQRVSRLLRLERITPEGVVLVYKDYRFRMNVI
jgi:general secretion pathway protein B